VFHRGLEVMMTDNQHLSCFCLDSLTAALARLSRLGASPRSYPHFTEAANNFWLDRLTVALTTGSIPATQTTRQKEIFMPEVIVRKGEPIDRALKRLKNKLDAEGIMEEVRRLRAFETPSQKLRRKAKLAAKRGKLKFRFNP
jgi:small subunit ribosomal protein S21